MAKAINSQESEQLLFPIEEIQSATPTKRVAKSTKPMMPAFLQLLNLNDLTLEQALNSISADSISVDTGWRTKPIRLSGNRIFYGIGYGKHPINIAWDKNTKKYTSQLAYMDELGNLWKAVLSLSFDQDISSYRFNYNDNSSAYCNECSVSEWTYQKNIKLMPELHFIQSEDTLWQILEAHHPFVASWGKTILSKADVRCLLLAPHLETLWKAGYAFANYLMEYGKLKEEDCTIFNRLCQYGTKPKDIFKTSKVVYSVLKDEIKLEIWDSYRKLFKTGKIGADTIQQVYDQGYSKRDLEYINSILAKKYEDKPVFTWNSLIQYLGRLDTFEAIGRNEAFVLLNDYLSMCSQLRMKPRVDGDSLKREHDIAARNCRNRRDEILAEQMTDNCEEMKKYDYAESIYFVRGIRDMDDLLDEANQQHNCVASYGQNIANGKSYIYVMREVANPNKSLITIELSPNGKSIRQKYLAYNQPIRNKSQSEFIERWLKHIKSQE